MSHFSHSPLLPRKPKHLDLHTGIGGFALAARWSGYETVAVAEIEPYCNELLAKRFPSLPNYGDIRKLCKRAHDCVTAHAFPDFFDLSLDTGEFDDDDPGCYCPICTEEQGSPIEFGDCECVGADEFTDTHGWPDVITSGFPCQDISNNGKGAGLDGARSGLWEETARITDELQPPFLIFENVAALKTKGFDIIATRLEALGYSLGTVVVPGYAVGAGHQRERVFAIAHAEGQRIQGLWSCGIEEPPALAYSPLPLRKSDGQWETEPDFRRTDDGLPGRVDGSARAKRLHALGNAIIPQIACAIFDILPYLARKGALQIS